VRSRLRLVPHWFTLISTLEEKRNGLLTNLDKQRDLPPPFHLAEKYV
jgi:hypothetical protein